MKAGTEVFALVFKHLHKNLKCLYSHSNTSPKLSGIHEYLHQSMLKSSQHLLVVTLGLCNKGTLQKKGETLNEFHLFL